MTGEPGGSFVDVPLAKEIMLRQVREDDCRMLWEWANEPEVRWAAFSSKPIQWKEHVDWFARKLRDPNCIFFIALNHQSVPVGQVRFEMFDNNKAEIHISVDRRRRDSHYGRLIIDSAVKEVFRTRTIQTIHAFIRPGNDRSMQVFAEAKFVMAGVVPEYKNGNEAVHYVRAKDV